VGDALDLQVVDRRVRAHAGLLGTHAGLLGRGVSAVSNGTHCVNPTFSRKPEGLGGPGRENRDQTTARTPADRSAAAPVRPGDTRVGRGGPAPL
jgi:hypothetical protein